MKNVRKHSQAKLYPSELVTLGLLYAIKGDGGRAFWRWADRNLRPLFPGLPERTRLFRLLAKHQDWADRFLADPTVLGVIDSYGIELIHPVREHIKTQHPRIATKGKSNYRWIIRLFNGRQILLPPQSIWPGRLLGYSTGKRSRHNLSPDDCSI